MCGIVAAMAYGDMSSKVEEKVRQEAMIFAVTELLLLTQNRGKEATGITTLFDDCDYIGLKMGVQSSDFITRFGGTENDYEGFLKIWRKKQYARAVLGHCRKPTTGSTAGAEDNKNNHPIKVGNIIGVHNGTIANHDEIFKNLESARDGNVDSEAIFRLLHHFTKNGEEPFCVDMLKETCKRLDGTYAVLTYNANNPFQVAGFRDGRPIELLLIKPLGILLVASEKDFLKGALIRMNTMAHLYQTGKVKFPSLEGKDIELESLDDDHAFLFDLRKEITSDTKIKDLLISERISRTDKIWKKYSNVNTSMAAWNRNNLNATNNTLKKAEAPIVPNIPKVLTQTVTCTTANKRIGMAFNREIGTFSEIASSDEDTESHKSVEIDVIDGEIIDIETREVISYNKNAALSAKLKKSEIVNPNALTLTEVDSPVDNLVDDPAVIIEIKVGMSDKKAEVSYLPTVYKPKPTIEGEVEVVDVSVDTKAMKKAVEAEKKEKNFSNNVEVADALDILNHTDISHLEPYSLANRIKSKLFHKWFYAGYMCKQSEEKASSFSDEYDSQIMKTMLMRAKNKSESSSKMIRNLKTLVKIFGKVSKTATAPELSSAVEDVLSKGFEANREILIKTFRSGDLNDDPVIEKVIYEIDRKVRGV